MTKRFITKRITVELEPIHAAFILTKFQKASNSITDIHKALRERYNIFVPAHKLIEFYKFYATNDFDKTYKLLLEYSSVKEILVKEYLFVVSVNYKDKNTYTIWATEKQDVAEIISQRYFVPKSCIQVQKAIDLMIPSA